MPYICPICTKPWRNTQDSIHCASCDEWVHHNNRNNCSGLTDTEFESHRNDETKPWKCDNCIAKTTSTSFFNLPFVHLDKDCLYDLRWIPPESPQKIDFFDYAIIFQPHLSTFQNGLTDLPIMYGSVLVSSNVGGGISKYIGKVQENYDYENL